MKKTDYLKSKNQFKIYFGLVLLFPLVGLIEIIDRFDIYKNGEFIDVRITEKESRHSGKFSTSYVIFFSYDGQIYNTSTGYSYFDELAVGDNIRLKTNEKFEHFLFPNENPNVRLWTILTPALIGISLIAYGLYQNRKIVKNTSKTHKKINPKDYE